MVNSPLDVAWAFREQLFFCCRLHPLFNFIDLYMNIAIISSSIRKGRLTHLVAQELEKRLSEREINATLVDLGEYTFWTCNKISDNKLSN